MNNKKIVRDGHMHSPYCPHGTKDSFEMYVDKALIEGLEEITFTEHMPFPCYFIDDKEFQDECAPNEEAIQKYFKDVEVIKLKYKDKIKINIGLEVDFVDGYEEETKRLLNSYGYKLEDGLLSVHFIKMGDEYVAIDGKEGFERALEFYGTTEKVYDKYYETLLKAIRSDLGKYKPRRIGHPNLIRIFNKLYPLEYKNKELLEEIVREIKSRDYEVDVNTAGLRKPYCGEIYVSDIFKQLIDEYGVKKVYGSDSHTASDVGRDFDKE
ncbi:histidinol-phosphatase HisJ [Clostridium beijerinckii]|uniref:histidinol-phosphatase HisJ n=1 Tax=Clostridium beijerinckii TaxID=1520 RepID=UPI001494F944|nr:histidinol-phosphatase HisJ [Clostridium beijerinckii]NOW03668.1 histidinol-phosphatase (PHP family) [Clostridium beijerinckii]NYC03191.1 histidinol-phosphatase (PHP family) [Clostridium beijerinckii]